MTRLCMLAAISMVALAAGGCLSVTNTETARPTQQQPQQARGGLPTVAAKTAGMTAHTGLLTCYVDDEGGRIWLQLDAPDEHGVVGRYIYFDAMRGGLGSNPVGIDRGQLGDSRVVRIRRIGPKVVIEQENLAYRALSEDSAERNAVRESFASSILWGGEIEAIDEGGRALVDLTPFLVRDAHGVVSTLRQTQQGDFSLDRDRSFAEIDHVLAFPDNVEFEATLTFASSRPGGHVRSTAPEPTAVTLQQRHSFVRLPDDAYTPRAFDPRIASFAQRFFDYASAIDEPLEKQWIARHRLEKKDLSARRSEPVEPIVYYIDHGAPEPIRSALLEGARWWNDAFEAAGYIDAFQVEVLPADIHPLDVRYNVVQWVHRSTRGWSYGGSITDPRTGEIIKGHVSLGSLRVRQDRMIFEGLLGTQRTGTGAPDDPVQLSLARLRQLSAHEIGHTLGFAHNFAASTYDGRASVMDYPAPLVRALPDGSIDVSDAYGVGIGSWDKICVRYAYLEAADPEAERAMLDAVVREAINEHRFLSDSDARPGNASHPAANLWDNGSDPLAELQNLLDVRRIALDNFAENRIAPGRPMFALHEVLVPMYFFHRYQLDAVGKCIGGVNYTYAVRGDEQTPLEPVDAQIQRDALAALLATCDAALLDLPDDILNLIPPANFGARSSDERFNGATDPVFDPLAAARSAADIALRQILQPQRCARIIEQHRRDESHMSLREMLAVVIADRADPAWTTRQQAIHRAVETVIVDRLLTLARDGRTSAAVRGEVEQSLSALWARLEPVDDHADAQAAHNVMLRGRIQRYLNRTTDLPLADDSAEQAPAGSPIGSFDYGRCSCCEW